MLHSVGDDRNGMGTIITFPNNPESPYLLTAQYRRPSNEICIYQYLPFRSQLIAPFRGTFSGMVANVQDVEFAQSGKPKKCFELVDDMGSWIKCCALGRNANARALKEGTEVVVYYGLARPSLGEPMLCY